MSISNEGSESQLTDYLSCERVRVETLTSLFDKHKIESVELLLIDVEGAELPVLKGFPWAKFAPPKIYCEVHPYAFQDFDYTGNDFLTFL